MTEDWFEKGSQLLINELSADTNITKEQAQEVYSWLVNTGFIDYDIEKELIYDRYFGD